MPLKNSKMHFVKLLSFIYLINILLICTVECENSNQEIEQFSNSLNHIFAQSNVRLSEIGKNIVKISENQSSQNESECLLKIHEVLESGIGQEWSSNLIYANSFIQSDFASNILTERYTSLGDFDRCLSIKSSNSQNNISGQYCLVTLKTPQLESKSLKATNFTDKLIENWLNIQNRFLSAHGICAPTLCSETQLEDLIKNYFKEYLNGIELKVNYCQQQIPKDANEVRFGYAIASNLIKTVVFFSLFITLLYFISNTYFKSKLPFLNYKTCNKIFQCFDINYNVKCLFNFETSSEPTSYQSDFRYLNGLRIVNMSFIVSWHCLMFINVAFFSPISLFSNFPSFYHRFQESAFFNDTDKKGYTYMGLFCLISGFINTYTQLKNASSVSSFPVYAAMRWLRMVPSMVGTICLTILAQRFGSGPMFHEKITDVYVAPCYNNWWTNLLLINNFWTIDQACGVSLWFSAANFQLTLLLYPILWLYSRNIPMALLGSFALASLTFSSPFLPFGVLPNISLYDHAFLYEIPVTVGQDSLRIFYTSPLIYLLPFFLGAFVAMYLLNTTENGFSKPNFSIHPFVGDSLAILILVVGFNLMALPLPDKFENGFSSHQNVFFLSLLCYTLIIVCVLIAIIVAAHTPKSILKQILSARIFQFLNQLSYGIYLINPLVIWFNVHQNRHVQELNMVYIWQMTLLVYFESILGAMLLFIFFESPFRNLSRVLKNYFTTRNTRKIIQE